MRTLKIAFPYLLFAAMTAIVVWSNLHRGPAEQAGSIDAHHPEAGTSKENRIFDPVCRMEVNPSWGFTYTYEETTFYFCCKRCIRIFAEDPDAYLGERCMVCGRPVIPSEALPATYMGNTYYLCSEDHRREFKADPAGFFMHRMWGIPDWLYYISIGAVLILSFLMFEGFSAFRRRSGAAAKKGDPQSKAMPREPVKDRIDLMRLRPVRRLLLSRPFRFSLQLLSALVFGLIIAAGLFGHQNPALNIAPLLTWTIWWCGLVILIMFAGKMWCYFCPWDAIAFWLEKKRLWRKTEKGSGLGMPWPKLARNIWMATILFVGLTWVELGFGVTMRPLFTAYLGIAMLVMAIVSAFLFERKSFCRYGCLVGRVSGLYALFAGIEVRPRSRGLCTSCKSKECIQGTEAAYECPTFEYPGTMRTNTYCIQCTECLQACPHDNLAVNLRPWGADLAGEGRPRSDEAYLALLMLSITGFHGLTMTPVWETMVASIERILSVGRIAAFSMGMFGLMILPILIYAVLVALSHALSVKSRERPAQGASYRGHFVRYAYCLLPIALFYHLAHNLEHMLMEGPKIVAMISDPFGRGWDLLGTAGWSIPPLVSLDVLWVLQVFLVGVGHVYSLWAARQISRRIFTDEVAASRGQWPMLAGMIAFSILSLWLLKQPMEMRTSAM